MIANGAGCVCVCGGGGGLGMGGSKMSLDWLKTGWNPVEKITLLSLRIPLES